MRKVLILQSAFHNHVKSIITERKLSGNGQKNFSINLKAVVLTVKGSNGPRLKQINKKTVALSNLCYLFAW